MARILSNIRGSFVVKDLGLDVYPSIIQIGDNGTGIRSGPTDNEGALVVNFNINDSEKNSIIQCFGGVNHVYAFGHDPEQSAFSVTYLVFLGEKCMEDDLGGWLPGSWLKKIVDDYNKIKISELKKTIQVTCGNGVSYTGIALSLNASVHDPEISMISVTIAGKIVQ